MVCTMSVVMIMHPLCISIPQLIITCTGTGMLKDILTILGHEQINTEQFIASCVVLVCAHVQGNKHPMIIFYYYRLFYKHQ